MELPTIVSQSETPTVQSLQAEVARLREDLQMKDQLVQQLSQELFRLVKSNANPILNQQVPEEYLEQMRLLREQMQGFEEQVDFYQEQIANRDGEIYQLRQSVQELTDRSRMLEQVVQELPEIYRAKFAERMAPVKEKVEKLQRENRQLHAELQSVSYRLALRSRRQSGNLELPKLSGGQGPDISLPSMGNA
nr:Npun_F5560 family protein [Oxynema sp. CENA135]